MTRRRSYRSSGSQLEGELINKGRAWLCGRTRSAENTKVRCEGKQDRARSVYSYRAEDGAMPAEKGVGPIEKKGRVMVAINRRGSGILGAPYLLLK